MGLAKRIIWVALGAIVLLAWAAVVETRAMPIHPDLRKIVVEPQETIQLPLARAGWDGPPPAAQPPSNPTLERIGPEASAREAQRSLKSAAIPDFRAVAGIILVILLLRRMQSPPKKMTTQSKVAPPAEPPGLRRAA